MIHRHLPLLLFFLLLLAGTQQATAQNLNGEKILIAADALTVLKFNSEIKSYQLGKKDDFACQVRDNDNSIVIKTISDNPVSTNLIISEGKRSHYFILIYTKKIDLNNTKLFYDYSDLKVLKRIAKENEDAQRDAPTTGGKTEPAKKDDDKKPKEEEKNERLREREKEKERQKQQEKEQADEKEKQELLAKLKKKEAAEAKEKADLIAMAAQKDKERQQAKEAKSGNSGQDAKKLAEQQKQKDAADAKEKQRQKDLADAQEKQKQKDIADAKEKQRQKDIAEAKEKERQQAIADANAKEEKRKADERKQQEIAEAKEKQRQKAIADAKEAERQKAIANAKSKEEAKQLEAQRQKELAEQKEKERQQAIAEAKAKEEQKKRDQQEAKEKAIAEAKAKEEQKKREQQEAKEKAIAEANAKEEQRKQEIQKQREEAAAKEAERQRLIAEAKQRKIDSLAARTKYSYAELDKKYPQINFGDAPPGQYFTGDYFVVADTAENYRVSQVVLGESGRLKEKSQTVNGVSVTIERIAFSGVNAYIKLTVKNASKQDFVMGIVNLLWIKESGERINLFPCYVSDFFPVMLPEKELTMVYGCRAVNAGSGDKFIFTMGDRLGKEETLKVDFGAKAYMKDMNK